MYIIVSRHLLICMEPKRKC